MGVYDRGGSPKLPIVLMRAMPVAAPGPCKKVAGQIATTAHGQGLNPDRQLILAQRSYSASFQINNSSCADKLQRPDNLTSGEMHFLQIQDRPVLLRSPASGAQTTAAAISVPKAARILLCLQKETNSRQS